MVWIILEDSSKVTFGGGQRVSLETIEILKATGEKIIVCDSDAKKEFALRCGPAVEVYPLHWSGIIRPVAASSNSYGRLEALLFPIHLMQNFWRLCRLLKCLSREESFIGVYAATKKNMILTYMLSKFYRFRSIAHIHSLFKGRLTSAFFKKILADFDYKIFVSHTAAHSLPIKGSKVIYNPSTFKLSQGRKRTNPDSKFVVAVIGSLIYWKGTQYFIKAANALSQSKDIEFWIIGDGPERANLEALSKNDNIKFLGFIGEIETILDSIDLVVVPSISEEACPMVPIESFTKGIPVVTSAIGGQKEVVSLASSELLVPVSDSLALSRAIARLQEDLNYYNTLADKALLASHKFSQDSFTTGIKNVVSDLKAELQ